MHSEGHPEVDIRQRAQDALEAIEVIRSYVVGLNLSSYLDERMIQGAVERELLKISEACSKLLKMAPDIEVRFPNVEWRKIRGMGNVIRHDYDRVDSQIIWKTVTEGYLERLAAALAQI